MKAYLIVKDDAVEGYGQPVAVFLSESEAAAFVAAAGFPYEVTELDRYEHAGDVPAQPYRYPHGTVTTLYPWS